MKNNTRLDAQFDDLVLAAVRGDRRAITAIAIACGATLLKEARGALGQARANEDEEVLMDLCAGMTRGTFEFVPGRDHGRPWLRERVRMLSRASQTDLVVARATDGDPEAVGEVLEVFGDMLVEEARSVLGDTPTCDAEAVVQELGDQLLEGWLHFVRGERRGIAFLRRKVRELARQCRREARERLPGNEEEEEDCA